jgi:predicted enzyme related to lactoylglutathione lyase
LSLSLLKKERGMKRVTGIGGIFFKAKDPVALRAWYKKHLHVDVQDWGGSVFESEAAKQSTIWNIAPSDTDNMAPSQSSFMINYRVDNLLELLTALRAEGCHVLEKTDISEYGGFGWVMDPEGNKVELWQPPAEF